MEAIEDSLLRTVKKQSIKLHKIRVYIEELLKVEVNPETIDILEEILDIVEGRDNDK